MPSKGPSVDDARPTATWRKGTRPDIPTHLYVSKGHRERSDFFYSKHSLPQKYAQNRLHYFHCPLNSDSQQFVLEQSVYPSLFSPPFSQREHTQMHMKAYRIKVRVLNLAY